MAMATDQLQEMQRLVQQLQRHVEELLTQREAQQADAKRLQQLLKEAEAARDHLNETVARLTKERDDYRRAVCLYAQEQFTQADFDQLNLEEMNVDLAQFVRQLEQEMESKGP